MRQKQTDAEQTGNRSIYKRYIVIFCFMIAVSAIGVILLLYKKAISLNIEANTYAYLEEVTGREINHLAGYIDHQYQQLSAIDNRMNGKDIVVLGQPLEPLTFGSTDFIAAAIVNNGYNLGQMKQDVQGVTTIMIVLGIIVICILFFFIAFYLIGQYHARAAKKYADSISATLQETDLLKQQAENTLEYMAYFDELTGIANQNLLRQIVGKIITEMNKEFAYVILDLRKFKLINNLFGYIEGDLLLKHIAQTLNFYVMGDEGAAHISADIFHMFLIYEGKEALEQRLLEIAEQICEYNFTTDFVYHFSVGFGVYVVENKEEPIEMMGDKARLALKATKNNHTTSISFYNDEIRNQMLEEQAIENDMQQGIDNNEFIIFYQPKYSPTTNQLSGAEALVRWQHPLRNLISPGLFISIFENNGFIVTLDLYILEQLCKTIRQWLDEGKKVIPISINQSRLLLYSNNYMETMVGILEKYNVPHHYIELEITESVFFEDMQRMVTLVSILHELNFNVLMDDFGSGYSSLNMLKDIKVDIIKIDKDFFSEGANSDRGRKIVNSVVSMAKDLDIRVVAEGVETEEQVDFLRKTGCHMVQGYYFSKPLPQDQFEELIDRCCN